MYKVMTPNKHFTDVNVSDINNAMASYVHTLISQLILDADLDELSSMDFHKDLLGLAVVAEVAWLNAYGPSKDKLMHVMKCALAAHSRLAKLEF